MQPRASLVCRVCLALDATFAVSVASAMMPPHIDRVVPDDGLLDNGRIVLHGYTLSPSEVSDLKVVDETTGEASPFSTALRCEGEGDRDGPPGAYQERCVLAIDLERFEAGHVYAVAILGQTYRFTASEPGVQASSTAADRLQSTLSQILLLSKPDGEQIAAVLGVEFSPTRDNRWWRFFQASLVPAPYSSIELKLARDNERGLLVLGLADDPRLGEDDLDTSHWGRPVLDVNPEVPPEGVVTHVYTVAAAMLSLQFTARSMKLRQIAVEWGP